MMTTGMPLPAVCVSSCVTCLSKAKLVEVPTGAAAWLMVRVGDSNNTLSGCSASTTRSFSLAVRALLVSLGSTFSVNEPDTNARDEAASASVIQSTSSV